MKLQKIAKLCKEAGTIILYESEDLAVQWLGDGDAFYPLHGLRRMDETSAKITLDVPRKDFDSFHVEVEPFPDDICFRDADPRENQIEPFMLDLALEGGPVRPLRTQCGLVLLEPRYLDPIDRPVTLFERISDSGLPYIAAKAGLDLVGIILPRQPANPKLAKELKEIAVLYNDVLRGRCDT